MDSQAIENVLKQVRDNNIEFIRLWFTDIFGTLKSVAITPEALDRAMDEGMAFDGSSVTGYQDIQEGDMFAVPDPSTFCVLPWLAENGKKSDTARMFCDIKNPDGTPYEGDPRYVLKRNCEQLSARGLTFFVGPELEFFYFKHSRSTDIIDYGGYFDLTPMDAGSNLRKDTITTLKAMGIPVEFSHHEVAPSQHEIDLRYSDALRVADRAITYRLVVKEIAAKNGVYATFMPKPIYGQPGSGMHTHQSLFSNGTNVFYDDDDEFYLSDIARKYIAGLLRHSREICSVLAQWVNSYKRLVPGYEAPVYIAWSHRNRSALVRVPAIKPGKKSAARVELRCPDPACNPYLAFSVMLAAGLAGIDNGYELPPPMEKNLYELTESERRALGIQSLPASLGEALAETEKSELVRKALGDHVFERFIELKSMEWHEFCTRVTEWEVNKYLPIL